MENLVITGHTSGIGKYIYEKYGGVGLSRSTGFDICKDDISQHLYDCVLINNAFSIEDPDAQLKILQHSYNLAMKVICIGTNSQYEGVYKTSKDKLKKACKEYFLQGYPVTYLALGKVDTPYTQKNHPDDYVISKQYIINCMEFILNSPYRIEILSVRPD